MLSVDLAQAPKLKELDPTALPEITDGQSLTANVYLRVREIEAQRKAAFWNAVASVGTGGLALLTLVGVLGAWLTTGELKVKR